MINVWSDLFLFMLKFLFVVIVVYPALRGLIQLITTNIYGGKLAIEQEKTKRIK